MFKATVKQPSWRTGKIRLAVAAAICAVGLGVGFGGSALLAGLNEGNPVPNTEGPNVPTRHSPVATQQPIRAALETQTATPQYQLTTTAAPWPARRAAGKSRSPTAA